MSPLALCLVLLVSGVSAIRHVASSVHRPSVQAFTLSNGDRISCIRLEDQPSLARSGRVPSQTKPSAEYLDNAEVQLHPQLFQIEVGSCPEGTIPFLHEQAEVVDTHHKHTIINSKNSLDETGPASGRHEHAIAYTTGSFSGVETTISVWNPQLESDTDFSLSQLWVMSRKSGVLNSIEAGWQVSPTIYGTKDTRLFVYWTGDNYASTGCYNLRCAGFVQVSNKFVLGGTFGPVSVVGSTQAEKKFRVFQDKQSGNWWLRIDGIDVGYWPASLFNSLKNGFEQLQLGGEVYYQAGSQHTRTQMGSGLFPDKGYQQAAYHRNIQVLDAAGNPKPAANLYYSEKPGCYSSAAAATAPSDWGSAFFYGGPGLSASCP